MSYIECCTKQERNGTAWLFAGMRRLRKIRKKTEKGKCTLFLDKENIQRTLLSFIDLEKKVIFVRDFRQSR